MGDSDRINTEELIEKSQQAGLDRDSQNQEWLQKSHAARAKRVGDAVTELSGTLNCL
jgi:hypothetical protein